MLSGILLQPVSKHNYVNLFTERFSSRIINCANTPFNCTCFIFIHHSQVVQNITNQIITKTFNSNICRKTPSRQQNINMLILLTAYLKTTD